MFKGLTMAKIMMLCLALSSILHVAQAESTSNALLINTIPFAVSPLTNDTNCRVTPGQDFSSKKQ
jgi:hypothetical protein